MLFSDSRERYSYPTVVRRQGVASAFADKADGAKDARAEKRI
jgi:hypothetical protein